MSEWRSGLFWPVDLQAQAGTGRHRHRLDRHRLDRHRKEGAQKGVVGHHPRSGGTPELRRSPESRGEKREEASADGKKSRVPLQGSCWVPQSYLPTRILARRAPSWTESLDLLSVFVCCSRTMHERHDWTANRTTCGLIKTVSPNNPASIPSILRVFS